MERRSNCVKCGDTRKRFYERDTDTGTVSHCFNCGFSTFVPFKDRTPQELLLYLERRKQSVIPSESGYVKQVRLPIDFTERIPKKGLQWFYKYGIFDDVISKFKFGYSEQYNRIILPVFDNEKLVYYQARTLDTPTKNNPKYVNVRQAGAKNVWFKNISHKEDSKLVVVEDILSACKVGQVTNCIALLGSYIPDSFTSVAVEFDKICLWLDRDKFKEALKYASKFRILTRKQVVVVCETLDPKEYSVEKIEEILNK